jgi:putative SOS response-associated peptidase YedK
VPYLFRLRSRALFGFAAIWNDPEKGAKRSLPACAILTTRANALVRGIHPRMPVLVRREHEPLWGAPKTCDFEGMSALLAPYPGEEMERFRVTSRVNAASYDSPGCVEPLEEEDEGSQMKLFS